MKAKRRFAWIMLSQNAQVIAIDEQTLTLGLVNAGARESFARSGSDEILQQAMIDTIGLNRRIEAVVDPSSDPGATPPAAPPPARRPRRPGMPATRPPVLRTRPPQDRALVPRSSLRAQALVQRRKLRAVALRAACKAQAPTGRHPEQVRRVRSPKQQALQVLVSREQELPVRALRDRALRGRVLWLVMVGPVLATGRMRPVQQVVATARRERPGGALRWVPLAGAPRWEWLGVTHPRAWLV